MTLLFSFGEWGEDSAMARSNSEKGARELFAEGESLFRKKQFKAASGVFAKILRRFPDHQATIHLYARTAYALRKMRDAYDLFSRVPVTELSVESSYEYGYTAYRARNWMKAQEGFDRVPHSHSLSDLASYYGGISAMKQRNYRKAEAKLERAAVLPKKLAKSRDIYLKHLEEIRLLDQEQRLAKQRKKRKKLASKRKRPQTVGPDNPRREKPPRKNSKNRKSGKKKKNGKSDKDADAYAGTLGPTIGVSGSLVHIRQLVDMNGFSNNSSTTTIAGAQGNLGAMKTFPFQPSKGAFGGQLVVSGENVQKSGRRTRTLVYEDLNDLERIQTDDPSETKAESGAVSASVWIEAPFGDYWSALVPSYSLTFPKFKTENQSAKSSVIARAWNKDAVVQHGAGIKHESLRNSKNAATTNIITFEAKANYAIIPSLLLSSLTANHKAYEYIEVNMNGPDAVTTFSAGISYSFPLGVTVGGDGSYAILQNQTTFDSEHFDLIAADGSRTTMVAYVKIAPVSWIAVKLSQLYSTTSWDGITPVNAIDEWDLTVPTYKEELTATLTLNLNL